MTHVPKIENINNIRNVLGHAIKFRAGYMDDLRRIDLKRGLVADEFAKNGLISRNAGKYKITEQGEQYFKDMFGEFSYYKAKFSGNLKRLYENINSKLTKRSKNQNG